MIERLFLQSWEFSLALFIYSLFISTRVYKVNVFECRALSALAGNYFDRQLLVGSNRKTGFGIWYVKSGGGSTTTLK